MSPATNTKMTHTELSLRTAFILRPAKLLDEICEAVLTEEDNNSHALLSLILKHDYISLIFGMIESPDTSDDIRNCALWTAGLLVASDWEPLRAAMCTDTFAHIDQIARLLFNECGIWNDTAFAASDGQRSAAYLASNAVKFAFTVGNSAVLERLRPTATRLRQLPKNAQVDYYWALAHMFERAETIPAAMVHDFLTIGRLDAGEPIVCCLSALCERSGAIRPDQYALAFDLFLSLFEETTGHRQEIFWALSNLLCEPGAADLFGEEHYTLQTIACSAAASSSATNKKREALWVLANWIANCSNLVPFTENDDPVYAILSRNQQFAFVREVIEMVDMLRPDSDSGSDSDSDSDSESSDETEILTNAPEHLFPAPPSVFNMKESHPPSALQLIAGADLPAPSETVRRLITDLKAATSVWSWIPVLDNTVLTAGDLRWMEAMGYTVSRGFFGVASWMRC